MRFNEYRDPIMQIKLRYIYNGNPYTPKEETVPGIFSCKTQLATCEATPRNA